MIFGMLVPRSARSGGFTDPSLRNFLINLFWRLPYEFVRPKAFPAVVGLVSNIDSTKRGSRDAYYPPDAIAD
jgi:hypothetical protein